MMMKVLPQSGSDDVRLDAGLQGVKCNAAQHLQEVQKESISLKIFLVTF